MQTTIKKDPKADNKDPFTISPERMEELRRKDRTRDRKFQDPDQEE